MSSQLGLGFEKPTTNDGPVECLGMNFESDTARRTHFLGLLREKLQNPEFRTTPGFPNGSDEAILRMSDPPFYTACPNPFLEDFVRVYGKAYDPAEPYEREPFAVDVSVGKTDQLYKAHGYHTKVPHLAIVPSILHYTRPGDIVLDGFCGSGMTGLAAQWCGTAPASYRQQLEAEWKAGITSTFAGPERRQNGYWLITSRLSATSAAISPSYSKSTRWPSSSATASRTFSERSPAGWPKLEKASIATRGS